MKTRRDVKTRRDKNALIIFLRTFAFADEHSGFLRLPPHPHPTPRETAPQGHSDSKGSLSEAGKREILDLDTDIPLSPNRSGHGTVSASHLVGVCRHNRTPMFVECKPSLSVHHVPLLDPVRNRRPLGPIKYTSQMEEAGSVER